MNKPKTGDRVRVHYLGRRDYNPAADIARIWGDGCEGKVIEHSDAHGLCFRVGFTTTSGSAWYDADELDVLS